MEARQNARTAPLRSIYSRTGDADKDRAVSGRGVVARLGRSFLLPIRAANLPDEGAASGKTGNAQCGAESARYAYRERTHVGEAQSVTPADTLSILGL